VDEAVGGVDMVVVSAEQAPGWASVSEEGLRERLREAARCGEEGSAENGAVKALSVLGVFAIP
jgi:hypothetical protein